MVPNFNVAQFLSELSLTLTVTCLYEYCEISHLKWLMLKCRRINFSKYFIINNIIVVVILLCIFHSVPSLQIQMFDWIISEKHFVFCFVLFFWNSEVAPI